MENEENVNLDINHDDVAEILHHNYLNNRCPIAPRIIKSEFVLTSTLSKVIDIPNQNEYAFLSRNYNFTQIIQNAIKCLEIEKRTESDCLAIYGFLAPCPSIKSLKSEYGDKILYNFIKALSIAKCAKKTIIQEYSILSYRK